MTTFEELDHLRSDPVVRAISTSRKTTRLSKMANLGIGPPSRWILDIMASKGKMIAMTKVPRLSDQVRAAIRASGVSPYRIAKELGLDQATLSRFLSGDRGLRLNVLDDLSAFLGLRIVTGKARSKAKR